jgi:chemotaxis protein methyltransferase WspC
MTIGVDFERLLKDAIGLHAASIGSPAIERAVQERMSACRILDAHAYWEHVTASSVELYELVEAVVVPETWFFRDRKAFEELARVARCEWLLDQPQRVLRVLSVPCATGEEPYSAVMALFDAEIPASRICIDAIDVSERALARARQALYGRNSFRGNDLRFRDRYFEPVGSQHRLDPAVRAPVRFEQGNLLAGEFLPGIDPYDAIFCRNVLIYFDEPTQDRVVGILRRLLGTRGVLFVGPAESGLLLRHGFVSSKAALAFGFHMRGAQTEQPRRTAPLPPRRGRITAPESLRPRGATVPSTPAPPRAPPVAVDPLGAIEKAERLADQGRLAEAMRASEDVLRSHGPSARAFQLSGLICNASGDLAGAAVYFRKALYLDANDAQSLIHLALLLEKQGDLAGARRLRSRLQRVDVKDA